MERVFDPMNKLLIDQSKELVKVRSQMKSAEEKLTAAQIDKTRAQAQVTRAQSAVRVTSEQIDATMNALASLDAQACNTDPKNGPAIRRLSAEQSDLGIQRRALEGQKQREQEQLAEAEKAVSAATLALAQAEDALKKARSVAQECEFDAQEARYVANGDPLPKHLLDRKTFRERMESDDHLRKVRNTWELAQREWDSVVRPTLSREKHDHELQQIFDRLWAEKYGGKPPSEEPPPPAVKTEPPSEKPLQPGEHGWGRHRAQSFESRVTPPVPAKGFSGGTESGYDPFAPEHD